MMWEHMSSGGSGALLFGRRTYEDFFSVWPNQTDNPFTPVLNAATKYVASRTLEEPLPWENSRLLEGDAVDAVTESAAAARRRRDPGGAGSSVRPLLPDGLIDEFVLLIHPLVLGTGRLFPDEGSESPLQLVESAATPTALIATFRPA